jgi:hypothetical protein
LRHASASRDAPPARPSRSSGLVGACSLALPRVSHVARAPVGFAQVTLCSLRFHLARAQLGEFDEFPPTTKRGKKTPGDKREEEEVLADRGGGGGSDVQNYKPSQQRQQAQEEQQGQAPSQKHAQADAGAEVDGAGFALPTPSHQPPPSPEAAAANVRGGGGFGVGVMEGGGGEELTVEERDRGAGSGEVCMENAVSSPTASCPPRQISQNYPHSGHDTTLASGLGDGWDIDVGGVEVGGSEEARGAGESAVDHVAGAGGEGGPEGEGAGAAGRGVSAVQDMALPGVTVKGLGGVDALRVAEDEEGRMDAEREEEEEARLCAAQEGEGRQVAEVVEAAESADAERPREEEEREGGQREGEEERLVCESREEDSSAMHAQEEESVALQAPTARAEEERKRKEEEEEARKRKGAEEQRAREEEKPQQQAAAAAAAVAEREREPAASSDEQKRSRGAVTGTLDGDRGGEEVEKLSALVSQREEELVVKGQEVAAAREAAAALEVSMEKMKRVMQEMAVEVLNTFFEVLSIVTLHGKCTRALTFENFCRVF